MITVLFRTIIIYFLLVIAMRLMGKRQIGELEISDLVTTFLLSEIASLPITDTELPLAVAIIPIITILILEVTVSLLLSRFPKIKSFLSARPTTIIKDGQICQKAMKDTRLSFDELFSELRLQGVDDISQIKYAILEPNGNITVIQKARFRQPNAEQLHLKPKENGLFHVIIEHGTVNKHGLTTLGLSEKYIDRELTKRNLERHDIYLMMINDAHDIQIITKEKKSK